MASMTDSFKFIDIHTHLLPGVDDGAKNFSQSVSLIKELELIGVTEIILTPHYSQRKKFTISQDTIDREFLSFVERCKTETNVGLHLGREIEFSQDVPGLLSENGLSAMAKSGYVLIEFSASVGYREIAEAVRRVYSAGFKPIIAHIERYRCIGDDIDKAFALKKLGADIQMNLTSFASSNRTLKRLCKKLIKLQIPDYMGTDTHCRVLPPKEANKIIKRIIKLTNEEYSYKIFYGNAHNLLLGE